VTKTRAIRRDDLRGDGAPVFVERRDGRTHRQARSVVTHQFASVALCSAGHARFELRGTWTLAAGDVLLVPPGEPHRLLESNGAAFWLLGFCGPCFLDVEGGALLEPFERVRAGASPTLRLPPDRQDFVERLLRELEGARVPHGRPATIAVQRSLLTLILHEVARTGSDATDAGPGLVSQSLQYIQQNCLRPLTLIDVARAVGRSPAHVTTAIRRATGRSAVAWIVAGRMAEARRRLLHSDEHVDVIAEHVGYADPTHFIRMFRREHGETPAAWRSRHSPPC
jgi:AraC family transcriptional activator of pobA